MQMELNDRGRGGESGKLVRRNYWAFLFEGGFFVFGLGFVNGQTVLPALILEEGGSSWLAAFMPSIMVIGLFGMPLLLSGWIDGFARLKPYVLLTGLLQRLVYAGIGLILLSGEVAAPWVVILLALTPLLSGLLGGFGFAAWQRLYMNGVPPARRASNLAYRLLIGGVAGIVAGILIERILQKDPGPIGYGKPHLWAAAFFMASWMMLWFVREESAADPEPSGEHRRRGVRAVMSAYYAAGPQRRSRMCFAASLFLMHGFMLITPFFAVTLLERLNQPKSFLGILAMWQMGGQAVGNLSAAWIGDRWGGRATFAFGLIAVCFSVTMAASVETVFAAQLSYAAFSFSIMMVIVGKDTLLMELSPERGQSSYLAGMAGITMVALLSFGVLSRLLWTSTGGFGALVVACAVLSAGAFATLSWVEDPRGVRIPPLRAIRRGFLRVFR